MLVRTSDDVVGAVVSWLAAVAYLAGFAFSRHDGFDKTFYGATSVVFVMIGAYLFTRRVWIKITLASVLIIGLALVVLFLVFIVLAGVHVGIAGYGGGY